MQDDYGDGEVMLMLANCYAHMENKKNAKIYYKMIIKNHPDTAYAKAAQSGLDGKIIEANEVETEDSEDKEKTEESSDEKKTEDQQQ